MNYSSLDTPVNQCDTTVMSKEKALQYIGVIAFLVIVVTATILTRGIK